MPYLVYLFDPSGNPVHRVRSIDPNLSSGDAVLCQDVAVYDAQGLLHADIDTITGGFNASHLDPVGFQGQTGSYTDTETLHTAAGLYTALSGPVGLYYNPETGVGLARSRADALNTYDQLLHPFDGWTFGAYAHEVGQFGIGEAKGAVNFAARTSVKASLRRRGYFKSPMKSTATTCPVAPVTRTKQAVVSPSGKPDSKRVWANSP